MIYGDRIRFRRDERTDIPKFVTWLNDPEVMRYLRLNLPLSQAEEETWFEKMLQLPPEEQPFAIETKVGKKWQLIGNCGFTNINKNAHSAEVGLFIGDKSFWNQGFGTQVMRLLLDVGFGTMNLNRIYLTVEEENKAGIRAYEKAGFIHEGRHRQAHYHGGRYYDVLFMSVLRSEWEKKR